MCGICGYLGTRTPPDRDVLEQLAQPLSARGPDDAGQFLDDHVALGHRRLSIIDLEYGRQPLANEDHSVWVAANGEIYNHVELRRQLSARGHRFRTRTDCEVLVHLYEEYGSDLLQHISGMFALALWDSRQRRLLLARDRMGQKPLYYALVPGGVVFASEMKALRAHPDVDQQLDSASLVRYLLHQYVPAPHSILRGVYKVDRAEALLFRDGRIERKWRYWHPSVPDSSKPTPPLDTAASELWDHLRSSVRRRLMSDVPLGVFLSGGIDSSTVVACMADEIPARQINTFTIGFRDRSYDESEAARGVARHFGTTHHERFFNAREMLRVLPEVAAYLDEPFADPSVLPTYLLCRFAREYVKVALGGDGGDELLGGYPTFMATRSLQWFRRLPQWTQRALERSVNRLPVSHRNMSLDFLLREFLRGAGMQDVVANQIWMGAFTPGEQRRLLSRDMQDELNGFNLAAELQWRYAQAVGSDPMGRLLDLYSQTYLQEGILAKVDRASMAHGLEVRAPFLDPDVVEYLGRLPTRYKLRGLETKRVLKRAAIGHLPRRIVNRTKHGFGIPAAAWLMGPLRDMVCDLLDASRLRNQGLFDPNYVSRLVEEHLGRRRNHRKPLWTLLVFQLWWERYGARKMPAPARAAPRRPRGMPQPVEVMSNP